MKLTIQMALVICGLFICDFAYMRSRNDLFSGTYPLIISHPWAFHMWIHYIRVYFWSPYPSHITRSNFILQKVNFVIITNSYKNSLRKTIKYSTIETVFSTFYEYRLSRVQQKLIWKKLLFFVDTVCFNKCSARNFVFTFNFLHYATQPMKFSKLFFFIKMFATFKQTF